jgi:hypothetical protein
LLRACCRHNRSRISWISLKMEKASSNETSVPYINLFIFTRQQSEIFISTALLISNLAQTFFQLNVREHIQKHVNNKAIIVQVLWASGSWGFQISRQSVWLSSLRTPTKYSWHSFM